MGQPMAVQLIRKGCPVSVFCRTQEQRRVMVSNGAVIAESLLELIHNVDVLFLMVPDDMAVQNLFYGDAGILSAKLAGKAIVNMSTVSPGINKDMAARCRTRGARYLDAPVSGSVKQAEEAKLMIMVGADKADFEEFTHLFEMLGNPKWFGAVGTGSLAKLAVNTFLAIQVQGLSEVINFAEYNGISAEGILSIINGGALGSVLTKIKGDQILNSNYNATFSLGQLAKDLRLVKDQGIDSPLANLAYETIQTAEATFGEEDIIAIKKHLQSVQKEM